jgi:hypothetical protein
MILVLLLFYIITNRLCSTYGKELWIGGIFPPSQDEKNADLTLGHELARSFTMAIKDAQHLIPNTTLKYIFRPLGANFITTVTQTSNLYNSVPRNSFLGLVSGFKTRDADEISAVMLDHNALVAVFGTSDPTLSYNNIYPNLVRMIPQDGVQGMILGDVLFNYYGFRRIVAIHSTSSYGTVLFNYFEATAFKYDAKILASIVVNDGQSFDFDYNLNLLKPFDPRIFVLFIDDLPTAAAFIEAGYKSNVFNIDTFLWASGNVITNDIIDYFSSPSDAYEILNTVGLFGVTYKPDQWKLTPPGIAFLRNWYSTKTPILKDNTGYFWNLSGYPLPKSWLKLSPYTAYVYDCVFLFVYGYLFQQKYNNTRPNIPPSYINMKNSMIRYIYEQGVTGYLNFTEKVSFLHDFGRGDMTVTTGIFVYAYQCQNRDQFASSKCFNRIGNWTNNHGLQLCRGQTTDNNTTALLGHCYPIVYGTAENIPLKDRADPIYLLRPDAFIYVYAVFGIILIGANGFLYWLLFRYRNNKILKICQLPILVIVAVCLTFSYLRIFLSIPAMPTVSVCIARNWLGHLNFTAVITMFVKMYRTNAIVNNKALKKVKISTLLTIGVILGIDFVLILLLILSTTLNKPIVYDSITTLITGQEIHDIMCYSPSPVYDYVLYAFEGSILIYVCKLCNDIKNAFDSINESKSIALCMAAIFTFTMAGFAIIYALNLISMIQEFITSLFFFLANFSFIVIYFFSKTMLLINGADLDSKFQIVYNNANGSNKENKIANSDSQKAYTKFLKGLPTNAKDCGELIEILQERMIVINMKGAQSDSSSLPRSSHNLESRFTEVKLDEEPPQHLSLKPSSIRI